MSIQVTLPDGTQKSYDDGSTPYDVAKSIGEKLAEAAIGARVNGELYDVHRPLPGDCELALVTAPRIDKKGRSKWRDEQHEKDALYLLRHSTAHVMAEAIERLYPDVELAYGPPLDTGFYYDMKLDTPIREADFARIEDEMKKIVEENRAFSRYELSTDEGMAKLGEENNKYKLDNAEKAIEKGSATLSWYITGESGNWEDLCMGPHVDTTSRIGAFKVMSVAASNWKGDVTLDRFQRVYGTAFFGEADLADRMEALEQAKARDHRVIGRQLGLFEIDEMVGQGLVLWKPKGAVVRDQLQKFISEHLERQGYSQVFTPHIGKLDLYRTSGHFPYYADSQYPPILERETIRQLADGCSCCAELADKLTFDGENAADIAAEVSGGGYMLKPMNCPHHIRIFASDKHSYRDLPIRLAEFGTVYRWEQSGELGGMTRVRGFTQDDAHLFVTPDQLADEVLGCIELVKIVFSTLGMDDYRVRVGLRDPDSSKFVGKESDWDAAEAACINAAESLGVSFSQEPGEAAFYGPKIDFVVKDVIGREWQLGTVQVDYQLPQRFELSYIGADNAEHRPIMIHRAPFGSMERFIGCLIEHFNGAFPLWLSPEQVRVLPISDKFNDYGEKVLAALKDAGFRADIDTSKNRVKGKVKSAQEAKVPYMLVVGGKDEEANTVSVRHRSEGDQGAVPLEEFLQSIVKERDERSL
ncbi:threonine--tRNA ligase [Algisphaera agarilytica]|uniref:Threonine--tRNA ligase n=1 Tax=Algisphaera agarilytica TaxID=1385975 RepID=A0A7X0H5D5_9BACT|nr:threonine--tRNA ligase [Algisphaera agarilytica]MBB6429596.1 threonyl-tRNA synthetase [Algisphaera agarilytica]